MKRYIRKPSREEVWNAVMLLLIVAVFVCLRFFALAVPIWIDTMLIYPLIAIRFVLGDPWTSILLLGTAAGLTMLVPCHAGGTKLRRYLLRPVLAVLVILGLSSFAVAANAELEDWIVQNERETYCREVAAFLDTADEVILYKDSTHNGSPKFEDARIRCVCGTYHDAIMIDYDTMRIAFLRHYPSDTFHVYQLEKGALTEKNTFVQMDAVLPESGNRLISYHPGEDMEHRTCALELVLADGVAYSVADMPSQSWDNIFLGLLGYDDYLFAVGQPHP